MWWLLAACGSCLLFSTAVFGTFVPLQNADGVEYLFAWPPAATILAAWLTAVVGLGAGFGAVRALASSTSSAHLDEARSGRWFRPIAALGVVALGIVPAVTGVGERGAVAGYILYDLRWWWAIGLTGWAIARADRLVDRRLGRIGDGIRNWSSAARLLLLDAVLFVGVITWAVATTAIRFDNRLSGDEPKYVRYCEAWYQGQGFDISSLALVRDQPLDARPALLRNGALFFSVIPQDIGAFARDIRNFVRQPANFRWNRARSYNGFVSGIHVGLYQIQEAGTCAMLFPGYFVDRYLLSADSSPDGKWPADLVMTNVMMLLTYGVCSVFLFRFLRNALGSEGLAWIWAAAAMLTLPTTAFAFQFYPELPALLLVLGVSNELLFNDRPRPLAAAAAGAAAGALAWLHARFLLICVLLAAMAVFGRTVGVKADTTYGYTSRARWAFLAAFAVVVFAVMAFDYHVTGSWSPLARMEADGQGIVLNRIGVVLNFIGYGLDRRLGLLPNSVMLVGALPGWFVLSRKSRRLAAFAALLVLALVVPASGYSLDPAGTTPGRFVAAVVPLLIWPVAVLVRRFWASPVVQIVTVALVVISLDTARAYNWHYAKSFGGLRDTSFSGWKAPLAFPVIRGEAWTSPANFVLFLCVAALIGGLSWGAFVRATRPASAVATSAWDPAVTGFVFAGIIGLFSAATSANGDWTDPFYLPNDAAARAAAMRALVRTDRCFCFTSARGHVNWTTMRPNSARSALVSLYPDDLRLTIQVLVVGDGQAPAFGRMRVEFGDGEATAWDGVVTERRIAHTYPQPGTYPVKVWFQLPARVSPQLHRETIEVRAGK
jgi:hypothetical protein